MSTGCTPHKGLGSNEEDQARHSITQVYDHHSDTLQNISYVLQPYTHNVAQPYTHILLIPADKFSYNTDQC
jgi:hypothetical protein